MTHNTTTIPSHPYKLSACSSESLKLKLISQAHSKVYSRAGYTLGFERRLFPCFFSSTIHSTPFTLCFSRSFAFSALLTLASFLQLQITLGFPRQLGPSLLLKILPHFCKPLLVIWNNILTTLRIKVQSIWGAMFILPQEVKWG